MLQTVMESTRDRNIRIATEGLRLVMECKVPRFCSSAGFDQMVQLQREWAKRLPATMPPLLDWMERHRQVLFGEEWMSPPAAAVQDFQKRFVLVFLEQQSSFVRHGEFQVNHRELESRLLKFNDVVQRILTTNTAIRSWLFHYYGSELGLQGWQSRPGDLYNLYYLLQFLDRPKLGVLFGQKMLSFVECIGKEMMAFPQNMEYQEMGILLMASVMDINHEMKVHTKDAEEILKLALRLTTIWEVETNYGDELWLIIYYAVSSFRDANCLLDDEVMMLHLLAYLNEEIVKKVDNPNGYSFSSGPLAYLRTITLMLLLDVPDVDFDELSISGVTCDRVKFRRHVKFRLQMADSLRFSTNIRLRIAKMIPMLFAAFTSISYVNTSAYKCLELLAWMTMFPVGPTRQQKNARAIMLTRLLAEIKRLCEGFIKNPSDYSYGEEELHDLNASLHPLLLVVRKGIQQLPNEGCFRRFKSEMLVCTTMVHFMVELLKQRRSVVG